MEILYPENLIEKKIQEEEKKQSGKYKHSEEAAKKVAFIYNTLVDYDDLDYDDEGIRVDVSPSNINASVSVSLYDIFLTKANEMKAVTEILDRSDRIHMKHIAGSEEENERMEVSFYVDNLWKVI